LSDSNFQGAICTAINETTVVSSWAVAKDLMQRKMSKILRSFLPQD